MKTIVARLAAFLLLVCVPACSSFERYPTDKTRFTFKGKSLLVAAQDRVTGNPTVEALFRSAAGEKAGSIHVLPLMPAPALELPYIAARLGLEKKGTQGLDPMGQLALNAVIKAGVRFGVRFDYIVFVTAEKANIMGQVINVDYYAALYEISSRRVIAAAKDTGTTTAETAPEQMPRGARRVVAILLDGELP